MVPCVLCGNGDTETFSVDPREIKTLIYTPNSYIVSSTSKARKELAVLREAQFHPIREEILHLDFFRVADGKPVSIAIPVRLTGTVEGVKVGGKLALSARKLVVSALVENLPDEIVVDVTELGVGKTIFVGDLNIENLKFADPGNDRRLRRSRDPRIARSLPEMPRNKPGMKYLIVGLGNIGAEYAGTRHNIGFNVLDALAEASNTILRRARYGDIAEKYKGRTLVLLKPSTYMNLSGKAVRYWMDAEKIPLENLLVVSDDIAAVRHAAPASEGERRRAQRTEKHLRTARNGGVCPHALRRGRRFPEGAPGGIRTGRMDRRGTEGPSRAAEGLCRRHPVVRNRRNGYDDDQFQQRNRKSGFRAGHITHFRAVVFSV